MLSSKLAGAGTQHRLKYINKLYRYTIGKWVSLFPVALHRITSYYTEVINSNYSLHKVQVAIRPNNKKQNQKKDMCIYIVVVICCS